ncbi:MAG: hypothetical protein QOE24_841 [Frankiales bacterium]|nr:hypothetical protein [Frankiales bacterium]MDX6208450.1 hypothetical protein [Frankiales bacterium]MDX6222347.1 hypothetical protein [Frankiales bacterium]
MASEDERISTVPRAETAAAGRPATDGEHMRVLYSERFGGDEVFRRAMWTVLAERFFQRYVPRDAVLVDIAAGGCEFVNAISARERIAVDVNPAVAAAAGPGVRAVIGPAHDMSDLADHSVDIVFASNFFEHLYRDDILAVMAEARRVLKPSGRFLILQPNIRYCSKDYWMFFDHVTPLDEHSLAEALGMSGFRVESMIKRFLPFSTKGRLPKTTWLVRAYLAVPPVWRLLGAQSFVIAEPVG